MKIWATRRIYLLCAALLLTRCTSVLATGAAIGHTVRGIVHMEVPQYPLVPRAALLQATVQLSVKVSRDGKVLSASVTSLKGNLDKSKALGPHAVENIKTWIFVEAKEETTEDIVYEYQLIPRRVFHPCSYVVVESPHHIIIKSEMPEIDGSQTSK